jgi:hypothetical protein
MVILSDEKNSKLAKKICPRNSELKNSVLCYINYFRRVMEQRMLKMNTNIYSYSETSDGQSYDLYLLMLVSLMLFVTYKPLMLSVVMLNVVVPI